MLPPIRIALGWLTLVSPLLSTGTTAAVAKDGPLIAANKFRAATPNIHYFQHSEVILFEDETEGAIYRSTDAGASWKLVNSVPKGDAIGLVMHPFDKQSAYMLMSGNVQFQTQDRGETWTRFDTKAPPTRIRPEILEFHATNPNQIIFNAMDCEGLTCNGRAMYTLDGFKTIQTLHRHYATCWWAKSTVEFTTGNSEMDKNRVLCVNQAPLSSWKLTISDSFFAATDNVVEELEPSLRAGSLGADVRIWRFAMRKYMGIALSSPQSQELDLHLTINTLDWERSMLPHNNQGERQKLSKGAFAVLDGGKHRILLDVLAFEPHLIGTLFASNSNGTAFTEKVPHNNVNAIGMVELDRLSGLDGVFLINVVGNADAVTAGSDEKAIVTKVTFDDGNTFADITAGDERLHLHSTVAIYSLDESGPAAGLVMANGNTGKSLGKFMNADVYISDDAGLTWQKTLDGPHAYSLSNHGCVLVAVELSFVANVSEFSYSLDRGETWRKARLPEDVAIQPDRITLTQDPTGLKFMLIGKGESGYHTISIDFTSLEARACEETDMEFWHARVDENSQPACVMGQKQSYRRRKKLADCLVRNEFNSHASSVEQCECNAADFECDFDFQRDPEDASACKPIGPLPSEAASCKDNPEATFTGPSGWRLIPGNACKRASGRQQDDEVERSCSNGDVLQSSPSFGAGGPNVGQKVLG